jgi:hypothetical protein
MSELAFSDSPAVAEYMADLYRDAKYYNVAIMEKYLTEDLS